VSWADNYWLPAVLREQLEHMRRVDPEGYAHVWEGELWTKNDAQVLRGKCVTDDFEVPEITGEVARDGSLWSGPYLGADWGFSQDPTFLTRSYVRVLNGKDVGRKTSVGGVEAPVALRRELYVREEASSIGCEIVSRPNEPGLVDLFEQVAEARRHAWRGDPSRPETISHMVAEGFKITAADSWSGSVEDGVTYLRGFERIVIHRSCAKLAEEARLWRYKVDKLTEKVLPALMPGYDHGWDSVRYAHCDLIQHLKKRSIFDVM